MLAASALALAPNPPFVGQGESDGADTSFVVQQVALLHSANLDGRTAQGIAFHIGGGVWLTSYHGTVATSELFIRSGDSAPLQPCNILRTSPTLDVAVLATHEGMKGSSGKFSIPSVPGAPDRRQLYALSVDNSMQRLDTRTVRARFASRDIIVVAAPRPNTAGLSGSPVVDGKRRLIGVIVGGSEPLRLGLGGESIGNLFVSAIGPREVAALAAQRAHTMPHSVEGLSGAHAHLKLGLLAAMRSRWHEAAAALSVTPSGCPEPACAELRDLAKLLDAAIGSGGSSARLSEGPFDGRIDGMRPRTVWGYLSRLRRSRVQGDFVTALELYRSHIIESATGSVEDVGLDSETFSFAASAGAGGHWDIAHEVMTLYRARFRYLDVGEFLHAWVAFHRREFEFALGCVDSALALSPSDREYRRARVTILVRLGRLAEAERLLNAIECDEGASWWTSAHWVAIRLGRGDAKGAEAACRSLEGANPSVAAVLAPLVVNRDVSRATEVLVLQEPAMFKRE